MKRYVSIVVSLFMVCLTVFSTFQVAYAKSVFTVNEIGKESKKVINIVYDDSGSMVNGDETDVTKASAYVATWSQAKYSLEVFAAMMNANDEMNIYCMSGAGKLWKSIKGSDREDGVKEIHSDMKTGDYSVLTPIQTLKKAYSGLSSSKYDDYEKWLVVLTDGAFTVSNKNGDNVSDSKVKEMISSYGKSLDGRVIYIPIGSSAKNYTGSTYKTLKASTGEEILNQVKSATEFIYDGRDKQELTDSTINLGVSMKKIIVFAQGAGVEIEGTSKGKITDNISVKYTEVEDAVKYDGSKKTFKENENKIKTDKSLQGVVVTIEPNGEYIEPGQLNITFGETKPKSYTMYYEPAVKAYYSLEKDGIQYLSSESETSGGSISRGTYILKAYVADMYQRDEKGTPIDVTDSLEIQDVAFESVFSGSGVVGGEKAFSRDELKNGVEIDFQNGHIECNSDASILSGKYKVDTSAMNKAFGDIIVKDTYRLEVSYDLPTASLLSYRFSKTNFTLHSLDKISKKKDMIKATVTCYDDNGDKVEITDEQWSQVTLQTLKLYSEDTCVIYDNNAFDFHTENGSGVFYLCPRYWQENDKSSKKKTTHTNYLHRKRLCKLRSEINIDVSDTLAYSTLGTSAEKKSTVYEISLCMWHTIISLFIFLWTFFCIFKKRLPKVKVGTVKNTECYTYEMNRRGKWEWVKADEYYFTRPTTTRIEKKMSTVLIPFVPQQGEIKLGHGLPRLKIEATEIFGKRSRVRLLNTPSSFVSVNGNTVIADDSSYVTIKGTNITKEFLESKKKKKFEFSTSQSVIAFGSNDGGIFKKYSLIFKKNKANKKRKK